MRPAVDASRLGEHNREAIRAPLKVDDDTLLVAALADPPGAVEALDALMAVGLAREAGRLVLVVISPNARRVGRAQRLVESLSRGRRMIVDERIDRPWELLGGCDAALVIRAGLSAAWAMAAGLPIVAPATPEIGDQLTHGQTALLASPGKVARLAAQFCRLIDDPPLRQRLGGEAQSQAHDRFAAAPAAEQWWRLAQDVATDRGKLDARANGPDTRVPENVV